MHRKKHNETKRMAEEDEVGPCKKAVFVCLATDVK